MKDCDLVIIGGGLAGLSLAIALRKCGKSVILIDKGSPMPGSEALPERALTLSDSSRRILSSLGIWSQLLPAAQAVRSIHVSQQGGFGKTTINCKDENLEALGWVVPYSAVLKVLYDTVAKAQQIQCIRDTEVSSFSQQDGRVFIHTQKAGCSLLSARLMVLASGGSKLRDTAGFGVRRRDYQQSAILCEVQSSHPRQHIAFERFTPHGPLALLPLSSGKNAVVWMQRTDFAEKLMAASDDGFKATLQAAFGWRLGKIQTVGIRGAYPLVLERAQRLVQGRVVLIGDAVHKIHPIAGQGYNLALRGVATLAENIYRLKDPADSTALQRYEQTRGADIRRVTRLTDLLARSFLGQWSFFQPLRGACLLTMDLLPFMRRNIVRRGLGLLPPYSRLACGLDLPDIAGD